LRAVHTHAVCSLLLDRYAVVILVLAISEIFGRSRTVVFARPVQALSFEEAAPSEILGLGLQEDGGTP
jgi:hypothetical protein